MRLSLMSRALTGVLGVLCATTAGAAEYNFTDLGTLGGTAAQAYNINNSGIVVGTARNSSGVVRAFKYSGGTMTDLQAAAAGIGGARGINSTGIVTGEAQFSGATRAFKHDGATLTNLGSLVVGEPSFGVGINDSGVIVGEADGQNGAQYAGRAFMQSGAGPITSLGIFAGGSYSSARAINNSGVIAGYGDNSSFLAHAFVYISGTMHDTGTLGGFESYAHAINDSGVVAGASHNAFGFFHAGRYSGGTSGVWTDLGDLTTLQDGYSEAFGINASGHIVGTSDITGGGLHAFIFKNGVMTDLNSLIDPVAGITLVNARDINDSGWIVGLALDSLGNNRAFLLTPVPEPAAVGLLGVSAILGLTRPRRR